MNNDMDLSSILESQKKSSSRWKPIFFVGLLLVLVLAGVFTWFRMGSNGNGTTYVTEPVVLGDLRVVVSATGNLKPTNEVTVGSELSGTIKTIEVDTNDQVIKGQVLARLDTSKLEQQIASSRASAGAAAAKVAQIEATLVENEAGLARLQHLHESSGGKLPSQANMDAAIAAVARAKADLAAAEAEVRQAEANMGTQETDLQKSIIRSPIDGIILTRNVDPGQTVAATMTAPELFVVAEKLENMKLEVAVAEADIGRVKPGQSATFTVDAWPNRLFQATVKKVEYGSSITDNVVTYKTELEVTNEDLSLRPGMTATAEIAVAEAEGALLVPNAALRFDPAANKPKPSTQEKKSFVQSLMPAPSRRAFVRSPSVDELPKSPRGPARVWILRGGEPEAVSVETGITDGRATVVSGTGLSEGLPVILHAVPTKP